MGRSYINQKQILEDFLLTVLVFPLQDFDIVSEKQVSEHKEHEAQRGFLCLTPCVCVYLQAVVVSPAAAVDLLGVVLVPVENRAEIAEVS